MHFSTIWRQKGANEVIVDSSALLAVILGESDAEKYLTHLTEASDLKISAATLVETSIVAKKRDAEDDLLQFLDDLGWEPLDFTFDMWKAAADGYERFSAVLNFGDCFAYGTAKHLNEPLLFKGNDFSQTDVRSALPELDGDALPCNEA